MVNIKTDKVSINKPNEEIFNFLSNFNNFEKLMPEQVINWNSTEDTCSFTVKGMADIGMRIKEANKFSFIHIASDGKVPFDFNMMCNIEPAENNQSQVQLELKANMNPMLAMMAKRPLQNLINIMVSKLKEHYE